MIEVIEIDENPDGTVRLTVDIDPDTVRILLESVLSTALEDYVIKRGVSE